MRPRDSMRIRANHQQRQGLQAKGVMFVVVFVHMISRWPFWLMCTLLFVAWFVSQQIVMCENHLLNKDPFEHTLIHELVHAYDQCRVKMEWMNCLHHACSEVIDCVCR